MVIHPSGEQRSARHEEKVLDGIQKVAAQIICEGCAGNVVKTVLFSGIGKGGHALLRGKHPRCKERGVAAAGHVNGAVRVFFTDGDKLAQDAVGLEQTCLQKNKLRLPAAPPEKGGHLLLPRAVPHDLAGTEVDDALRAEHIRRQNVLNGALVI